MKRILTLVFCALLAFGAAETLNASPKAKKTKSQPVTVVFESSIHCGNCAKKVEENISFEKGVKDLSVSVEEKTVTITYDPSKTDEETLAAAIEKLGYTAKKKK